MADDVNGSIRYSAKELFEKIDGKLDGIDAKLDDKIGRREFEDLKKRVSLLEGQAMKYAAAAASVTAVIAVTANHYL